MKRAALSLTLALSALSLDFTNPSRTRTCSTDEELWLEPCSEVIDVPKYFNTVGVPLESRAEAVIEPMTRERVNPGVVALPSRTMKGVADALNVELLRAFANPPSEAGTNL